MRTPHHRDAKIPLRGEDRRIPKEGGTPRGEGDAPSVGGVRNKLGHGPLCRIATNSRGSAQGSLLQ